MSEDDRMMLWTGTRSQYSQLQPQLQHGQIRTSTSSSTSGMVVGGDGDVLNTSNNSSDNNSSNALSTHFSESQNPTVIRYAKIYIIFLYEY